MKTIKQRISALILGILAGIGGFLLPLHSGAQSSAWEKTQASLESALPLDPESVPPVGTFYLLSEYLLTGDAAPYPFRPPLSPDALVYSLSDEGGIFLVDDSNHRLQAAESLSGSSSILNGELDFPFEGDESGGTNEPPAAYSYSESDLWLQIIAVTNNSASFQVHSPETNATYDLFSTTNLGPAERGLNVTTWLPVLRCEPGQTNLLVGDLTANECFFILAKTNDVDADGLSSAFEKLCSHTDPDNSDQNTNNIPDGWEWTYFGSLQPGDSDYDGDLISNYDEYLEGTDPNTIWFSLSITNHYLNSSPAPVQITVSGGVPSSMAVLVNSTNYAGATWLDFPAAADLEIEGWHDVWIGLRGRLATSQQTWKWIRLKLDRTPPSLIITNPAASPVMQPMIQVQGYCPETLTRCTYDLTNAAGLVTNQPVLVLDQFHDTNIWDFTTNHFQAFDVPLTNGPNTFTFHATDLAGNVSTTNITFTLDYSGKTNPPAIQLHWPRDGTRICGSNTYTWRGWVEDFTAQVRAEWVDAEGTTNEIEALVERDGKFWVQNLPAPPGTNLLRLTVTDAAGNVSTTNIAVTPSPVNLILNAPPVAADQIYAQVSGTIDSTNHTVWVNGVKAWLKGDGTWIASNAPVTPGGTAVFQARAIPNSDNGGNGSGGGGGGNPHGPAASTDNPVSAQAMDRESQNDKPAGLYLASYNHRYTTTSESQEDRYDAPGGTCLWWSRYQFSQSGALNWQHDSEATANYAASDDYTSMYVDYPPMYQNSHSGTTEDWWPVPSWQPYGGTEVSVQDGQQDTYPIGPPTVRLQEWEIKDRYGDEGEGWGGEYYGVYSGEVKHTWHRRAITALFTGGKGVPGQQSLFEINARLLVNNFAAGPIYVLGELGTAWRVLPDGLTMAVTPSWNSDHYEFGEDALKYTPHITANGVDLSTSTPEFCVGQRLTFAVGWDQYLTGITSSNYSWLFSSKFVNHSWQQTNWAQLPPLPVGSVNYDVDPDLLKLPQPGLWYVSKGIKNATINLTLTFNNGQTVTAKVKGKFTVHRPKIWMRPYDPGEEDRYYTIGYDVGPACKLKLGEDDGSGNGTMRFGVLVNSRFGGTMGITQLITANYSNPAFVFSDERCDGTEFYSGPNNVYASTNVAMATGLVDLDDGPSSFWTSANMVDLSCRDFVRFRPSGGIWVTLGILDWATEGIAEHFFPGDWRIVVDATSAPAGPDASDDLPVWVVNQGGMH